MYIIVTLSIYINIAVYDPVAGKELLFYDKPLTCPAFFTMQTGEGGSSECPCCCCLPTLKPKTSDNQDFPNSSEYYCDACAFQ